MKTREKLPSNVLKIQILQSFPPYTNIVDLTSCWFFSNKSRGIFCSESENFQNDIYSKKSAWKCPYGHLKRIFDKPADFFFFRFRSFLAKNPRTIKRRGSFQREFYSSVRRFRRTWRKPFWQKWRNSSNKVCKFSIFLQIFLNFFSRKKCSLECPSGHLVCMFNNMPQFFCPELQKEISLKVTKVLKTEKSTQHRKKLLSKLPLNRSFAVLRTCCLSGPKVCHRSGQALTIQKTGNFQREQNCSSGYVKYSFERSSSQSSKQFGNTGEKGLQKF